MCVCVCVRVCARACVRVCVYACICIYTSEFKCLIVACQRLVHSTDIFKFNDLILTQIDKHLIWQIG